MFAENIKQGLGSVKAHATRAVITSSIIAIGIAALVGILTSISAMQIAVTKTFSKSYKGASQEKNGEETDQETCQEESSKENGEKETEIQIASYYSTKMSAKGPKKFRWGIYFTA